MKKHYSGPQIVAKLRQADVLIGQGKNAGIKTNEKLTQHCLRKSWACNLANSSVPVHTLMKLGGWSSIETCQQFYLKTSDANEQKAVEALDKLMLDETTQALATGISWTQDGRRRLKNGLKTGLDNSD